MDVQNFAEVVATIFLWAIVIASLFFIMVTPFFGRGFQIGMVIGLMIVLAVWAVLVLRYSGESDYFMPRPMSDRTAWLGFLFIFCEILWVAVFVPLLKWIWRNIEKSLKNERKWVS